MSAGGDWGQEDIRCNAKNVFKITTPTYGKLGEVSSSWEQPIAKVELTLNNCKPVNGGTKCDIKIKDNIGLEFHPDFKPVAIFK